MQAQEPDVSIATPGTRAMKSRPDAASRGIQTAALSSGSTHEDPPALFSLAPVGPEPLQRAMMVWTNCGFTGFARCVVHPGLRDIVGAFRSSRP